VCVCVCVCSFITLPVNDTVGLSSHVSRYVTHSTAHCPANHSASQPASQPVLLISRLANWVDRFDDNISLTFCFSITYVCPVHQ